MKRLIFILSLFISANVFAQNGNIPLAGTIGTIGPNDKYPTHLSNLGKGGLDAVADIAARNAIPPERRSVNMVRFVDSEKTFYQLQGDTTVASWVAISPGNLFQALSSKADSINIYNSLSTEISNRTDADAGLQDQINTKASAASVSEIIQVNLSSGASTYTNVNYANKTAFLTDITTGGAGAVFKLTFNSSGVANLGFTTSSAFVGMLAGTSNNGMIQLDTIRSANQIFNKNVFQDGGFNTLDQNEATAGSARTVYYNIPVGATTLSFSGLTTSAHRIAWRDDVNGGGNVVVVNNTSLTSATIPVPAGAKSMRFYFKRTGDGTVENTFMLNWGDIVPYEAYNYIQSINGYPFADKKVNTINSIYATLIGTSPTVNASGWYKATPVVADVTLKGNTGLGYDLKRNLYIVSEYNSTITSRLLLFRDQDLVVRDTTGSVISTPYRAIDLTAYIDHIQGACWDFVDDTYLALGTLKGQATGTTNSVVIKVSPIGTLIDIIPLGDNMTQQVGMIDVLIDGNIGIKPNLGSTLYIFSRSYGIINRVTLIANEGFCVDKFTGDIWAASDAFTVKKYDKNYKELATYTYNTFTNESSGSNVEGMCVLNDGSFVISADAYLHGGTKLGNSLYFFDFENKVNKRRYFYLPNGVGAYNNLKLDYTSEMINPVAPITGFATDATFTPKFSYRSGTLKATVASAAFTGTLTSNTVFQFKIGL